MIFIYIWFSLLCSVFVFTVFMLIKSCNTCHNRIKILNGISMYIEDCWLTNDLSPDVDYDDMEEYDDTLFRLWDWGYKRILPKEKFEIIKPYIEKR